MGSIKRGFTLAIKFAFPWSFQGRSRPSGMSTYGSMVCAAERRHGAGQEGCGVHAVKTMDESSRLACNRPTKPLNVTDDQAIKIQLQSGRL
jgi:hypothetical protein